MEKEEGAATRGVRTRHYRDLLVWQKAMVLAKKVYRFTERVPQREAFGLQSQIRRAAVSIPSNIAEGHGRMDDGHFRQFLAIFRGSLFELQTQLGMSADLKYIDATEFRELMDQCEEVARMINGLLAKLASPRPKTEAT